MPNGVENDSSRKLIVDDRNRFHMKLPDGTERVIQLTSSEIYTLENWLHLIGKNPIRLEILQILRVYDELNITQLSQRVEQSKSTVARHLKSLEKHGIVTSRTATLDEYEVGKIPPKLYKQNMKLLEIQQYIASEVPRPNDSEALKDYYRRQIKSLRSSTEYFESLLDKTSPLFDKFENQIDDLPTAKEMWVKYFDDEKSPAQLGIDGRSFNKKYFEYHENKIK